MTCLQNDPPEVTRRSGPRPRQVQAGERKVRRESGLCRLDSTGKPPEVSIQEEMMRRYLQSLAQEKGRKAAKVSGGDVSR
jgi:hypothetical protein